MSTKRDYGDIDEAEISEPDTKRHRKQAGSTVRHQHQNSSIDPTWGQKYVFSNLDDATTIPYGEESDFEDDSDAMAYLSSVRREAYDIPHLLVAPKVQIGPQLPAELQREQDDGVDGDEAEIDRSIYANDTGDSAGYYDDGAYIAFPEPDNAEDLEGLDEKELHDAYYASILDRYLGTRKILHSRPPLDAISRLSSKQATYAAPFGRSSSTNKTWSKLMRNTDPHPLQLALMSKESVMRIIRVLLGGTFLRRGHTLSERTSHWLWGLLARLPDSGELNHAEIGWVRDLGRRAVLLGRSLAEMAALREELADGGLGVNEGVDASSSDEDVIATDAEVVNGGVASPHDGNDTPEGEEASKKNEVAIDVPGNLNSNNGGEIGDINEEEEAEEGEVQGGKRSDDEHDVAMDIDSGSEEGEAAEDDAEQEEDLEAAKKRLLARMQDNGSDTGDDADSDPQEEARIRLRINMRTTLNMILTVAGEFYGQRDLLEFREPFVGM